jgi:serine/threonine protein kinase, bacterial
MNNLEVSPLLKDRYCLLQPLATGGFSETYLAEDTDRPTGNRCVIKKMRVATDDPQIYQIARERFERESIILKDLGQDNPQIPTFYDFFVDDGEFLLVQEWIEGQTLTQTLQATGTFSIAAVQELLVSLLNVLSYIHSKKIIHRDIKPDNIILRKENKQPVLIDFGAVKEVVANTLLNARQKSTCSIVIGTPGFMSSEQAIGRPTYSSDLYSLGLTAIYLLTGQSPQDLPTSPDTGAILWQQSLPQLSASTYQTVLDASPVLAKVLDRAIESHPRDRFTTAPEMLSALEGSAQPVPTIISSPAPALQPAAVAVDSKPLKTGFWPLGRAASITAGSLMGGLMLLGLVLAKAPGSMEQTVTSPQPPKSPALATGAASGSQQNQAKEAKAIQPPSAPPAQPQPIVVSPQPVQSQAYPRPAAVIAQPSSAPIRPAPLPPSSPIPVRSPQPPQAIAQPSPPAPRQRSQVPMPTVPIKPKPPQAVLPSPVIPIKQSPEPAKQSRRSAKAAKVTDKRRVSAPAPAVPERVRERRQSAQEPRRESRRQRLVRQTPPAPPPQPAPPPPRRVQAPPPEVQPPPTHQPEVRERRRQASDADDGNKRRRKRD